ncbi:hypothetical protein JZU71_00950, partial [bacterium]|nr:hypothetical protein [bacterium]
YGYTAAILTSEGVLATLPGKPVMLSLGAWEPLMQKIISLKEEGISLTDHIAITAKERAEKKAQLMSNLRSTNSTESSRTPNNANIQDQPSKDIQGLPT